jgi:hypothetical protein
MQIRNSERSLSTWFCEEVNLRVHCERHVGMTQPVGHDFGRIAPLNVETRRRVP